MKRCPACKTTYTDDSLLFCLTDGSSLLPLIGEEQTVVRSAPPAASGKGSSGNLIKIAVGIVVLGIAAIAVLGIGGALYYYGSGRSKGDIPDRPTPSATPASTPGPTPDAEKQRLADELANLQKRLDEQKKQQTNTKPFPNSEDERGSSITATVNSPNDGFLALRSQPSTTSGRIIAKIPHSTEVEISQFARDEVTIGGRTGRWCRVSYAGQTGWVFDAWLDF